MKENLSIMIPEFIMMNFEHPDINVFEDIFTMTRISVVSSGWFFHSRNNIQHKILPNNVI